MTTNDLARLNEAATQGEWRYRPDSHDDWGIVKSGPQGEYGFGCALAQFRHPNALDEDILSQHRIAKTDPWAGNAQFVCALVNAYRSGQLIPTPAADRIAALEAEVAQEDRDLVSELARMIVDMTRRGRFDYSDAEAIAARHRQAAIAATLAEVGKVVGEAQEGLSGRPWPDINPELVAAECSPAHIQFMIRDAQQDIACLTALAARVAQLGEG